MSTAKRALCLLAASLTLLAPAPQAQAQTFASGSVDYLELGREAGYPSDFDHLHIEGLTGNYGAPDRYRIATLTFDVGHNAWNAHTDSGSFALPFSFDDHASTLVLPYSIAIAYADSLSIASASLSIELPNGASFNVMSEGVTLSSGVGSVSADLYATLSLSPPVAAPVPEPAAGTLAVAGLLLLAARRRRHRPAQRQ